MIWHTNHYYYANGRNHTLSSHPFTRYTRISTIFSHLYIWERQISITNYHMLCFCHPFNLYGMFTFILCWLLIAAFIIKFKMRNKHCQPSHIYVLASLILKFEFCKPSFSRWWNPSSTVLPTSPCMCQGCTKRKCVSAAQKIRIFLHIFCVLIPTMHALHQTTFVSYFRQKVMFVVCCMKIEIPQHLTYANHWMIIIFQDKVWNQVYHHLLKILNCESTFVCSNQGRVIFVLNILSLNLLLIYI